MNHELLKQAIAQKLLEKDAGAKESAIRELNKAKRAAKAFLRRVKPFQEYFPAKAAKTRDSTARYLREQREIFDNKVVRERWQNKHKPELERLRKI